MRRIPFRKLAVAVSALIAGTAAGAVTASAALGSDTTPGPRPCTIAGMTLPAGTAVKIDAYGNAWTIDAQVPYVAEQVCTDGRWMRITGYGAVKARPALPGWFHARRIPDACGRGDAGVMAWASHADQTVVVCRNGDVEPS